jgi:hypothetical protein
VTENNNLHSTPTNDAQQVAFFQDMSSHVQTESNNETQNHSSHVSTSLDRARFTMSVEEAAELFAQADLPRSKRSIARWCQQGVLDYVRVDTEKTLNFSSIRFQWNDALQN